MLHLGGSTQVKKWRDGRMIGDRPCIGSATPMPALVATTWTLTGHSRVAHIYIDPHRLAQAAERTDGPRAEPALLDLFAEPNEVAATLVRLMLAQSAVRVLDRLAHDEVNLLFARHPLRHQTAGRPLAGAAARVTLTAASLRRLLEHIDAGLAGELRLAEVAACAHLSQGHFVRALKALVGQTPHQYVLARRIAHAPGLLERRTLLVAAGARAAGFRGARHFAAAFRRSIGASPSAWRAERRH